MWTYRHTFQNSFYSSFLYHYGIKGMKWGVRRTPEELGHISKTKSTKLRNDINEGILDPKSNKIYKLSKDGKITNKQVFAGKGCKTKLSEPVKQGLSEQLGGDPESWQHVKGIADVDVFGVSEKAEIHWFQEDTVGKVKYKIKKWLEE